MTGDRPGALWYYHCRGPDFSGPHDRGYNILFADWHVAWCGEWVSEMMTRHAEYLQENGQPPKGLK
jgi:prepilin-type processing-associated H-X9-DG protein